MLYMHIASYLVKVDCTSLHVAPLPSPLLGMLVVGVHAYKLFAIGNLLGLVYTVLISFSASLTFLVNITHSRKYFSANVNIIS